MTCSVCQQRLRPGDSPPTCRECIDDQRTVAAIEHALEEGLDGSDTDLLRPRQTTGDLMLEMTDRQRRQLRQAYTPGPHWVP